MQGQHASYQLQNDQVNSDARQQQVIGVPQQYNYPQNNVQNPYPQQSYQQPQQQAQYINIPQGAIQQGQQVNHPQMSSMSQATYLPQREQPSSRYSQTLNCRNCKRPVETVINHEVGNGSYVIGGLMAAVGLWLGCCLIPCMMDDCKDAVHYCPNCGTSVGKKKFLFE